MIHSKFVTKYDYLNSLATHNYYVIFLILKSPKETEYNANDVEEVCQDWEPHVAHEVEDLPQGRGDLKQNNKLGI